EQDVPTINCTTARIVSVVLTRHFSLRALISRPARRCGRRIAEVNMKVLTFGPTKSFQLLLERLQVCIIEACEHADAADAAPCCARAPSGPGRRAGDCFK